MSVDAALLRSLGASGTKAKLSGLFLSPAWIIVPRRRWLRDSERSRLARLGERAMNQPTIDGRLIVNCDTSTAIVRDLMAVNSDTRRLVYKTRELINASREAMRAADEAMRDRTGCDISQRRLLSAQSPRS